jgi:DNA-binding response OmpR family regulator
MSPTKKDKKTPAVEEKAAVPAPAAPAVTPETKPPETAVSKAPGNGKSVLIVEDEKPLSHALEMKLVKNGYNAKVVPNGTEAIAELKANKYNMVLLDLIMPVMDGFELLTAMKAANINIPSIVLSNLGQEEDRAKAKTLGAIDYFVKANTPISEIIARVEKSI